MHDLGWTNPSLFSGPAGAQVLVRTVARYHAFLDVMTGGVTFLVPTLVNSLLEYDTYDLVD